jgi:hypothetical protein
MKSHFERAQEYARIGGKALPLQIRRKSLIWDGIGFDAYAIQKIDDVCSIHGRTELE